MSDQSILILGGTGLIGEAVAAEYLEKGSSVRVLARRSPTGWQADQLCGAEVMVGDVHDSDVLNRAIEGRNHVVYAIGESLPAESTTSPATDALRVIPGLLGVLDLLRERPEVTLTYLSSGGTVYGRPAALPVLETAPCEPITGYGITKLASEKYIGMYADLYGIRARILRISNAYGPGQQAGRSQGVIASLLAAARSGQRATLFGDSIRDYVYVDDLAHAIAQLEPADDDQRVVNVASGVGRSLSEVVEVIEKTTGARLNLDREETRPFDLRAIVLDVSRLRSLVHWAPRSLEDGVRDTWHRLEEIDS